MTSPCFITPTVVVLLEKEGVTKPDVPNDCDWYVWRGNGKGYVKQFRTIASIDNHTDGINRSNKRNRTKNSWNDDNDENGDFDNEEDDGNLRLDKTNEFIRVCLYFCQGA